ncbi:MAG: CoA transferase [Kiloniellales bacterium]
MTGKKLRMSADSNLSCAVRVQINGPVPKISEMMQHPQIVAREIITDYPHAELGSAKAIACPIKFHEADTPIKKSAPLLGQRGIVSDAAL